jgi:ABC-type multidrug transport system fused ATPase/permease subunit
MNMSVTSESPSQPLINELIGLFGHISKRRKLQFSFLLLLTMLSSLAEIISLGSVVPFIGILTQPERVFEQEQFQWFISLLQASSPSELIIPLTIGFAIAAVVAGVLRLLLLWVGIRLGNAIGADLGIEIFKKTLYQPYKVHVSRHSSEIISVITQKVGAATLVLIAMVGFVTSSVLFLAILATLLIVDPFVAIVACLSFGAAYFSIAWLTRKKMVNNSHSIAEEQTQVVRALQEGLGAIRDVLLNNAQAVYSNLYHQSIIKLQKAKSENTFINQAPRYAMEALGLVLIAMLSYALSQRSGGIANALPLLGLLALGAQRLLPLMQQIYGNWSVLAGSKASLHDVLNYLDQPSLENVYLQKIEPIPFKEKIEFKNIDFRYSDNLPDVLQNINLVFHQGDRVGIIGSTGSGKSTLLDLLMGLLEPVSGKIVIDDIEINPENRHLWQCLIAHVPQHIFLSDSSFIENIGFGIPRSQIDIQLVKKAAEQAKISDFIEAKPEQYEALVGERGVRLSGGERQRIGIARALYRQAKVLVFDEATSALDSKTEREVMGAIEDLSNELTVLIIAHRLSTLSNCNKIVELGNSSIIRIGTYDELVGCA